MTSILTAPTTYTLAPRQPISVKTLHAPQSNIVRGPVEKFVVGVQDSGNGYTVVQYSDGTTERREGDRGTRNNNPGNLTGTLAGAQQRGAIGVDHGGNYVFPNAAAGRQAMNSFVLDDNKNETIGDMLNIYAPPGAANDPNDTNRLYPGMVQSAGFNLGAPVGSLNAAEQTRLLDTMQQIETGQPAAAAAQPASFPLQQRLQNSGILPMLGGGLKGAAKMVDGMAFNPVGDMIGGGRDLLDTAGDFVQLGRGKISKNQFLTAAQENAQNMAFGRANPVTDALRTGNVIGGPSRAEYWQQKNAEVEAAPQSPRQMLTQQPGGLPSRLGLLGNPAAAEAVATETAQIAERVASSRGRPKPMTKAQRGKINPMNLGLIAFGMSLLGGEDMTTAMNNGMNVSGFVEATRLRKEQRAAVDDYISGLSPEEQEIARALDASGNIGNLLEAHQRSAEQSAAQAQKTGLVNQLAQLTGASPIMLQQLTSEQLRDEMKDRIFSGGKDAPDFTAKQQEAAFAALEMSDAVNNIFGVIEQGFNPTQIGRGVTARAQAKQFDAAFDRFLTAFIPFKSGKVFTEAELRMYTNALKPQEGVEGFTAEVNQRRLEALNEILGRVIGASNGAFEYYQANAGATGMTVPALPGSSVAANPLGIVEVAN